MNNSNNIRTNDFGNLSNSMAPRQNKFINMPEQNAKIKNRNKNDYSPFLRENKKNEKNNNNYPTNILGIEHNVNNSAGFMNMNNFNKNKNLLEFDNFNNNNQNNLMNSNNINNMNQNKMMSNTMNNFSSNNYLNNNNNNNNNNNYIHYNNFNNEKRFKVNDYSNINLNINNNFINYTPLIEDRQINHLINNNNINPNEKISRPNKNLYNNRPLNNFNPNLIKRRGTPQLGGHTSLLNRNQSGGPVKIKNNNKYNNNYMGNNNTNNHNHNHANKKKPTTPDLNLNHRQKHDFLDINSNNVTNTSGNVNTEM